MKSKKNGYRLHNNLDYGLAMAFLMEGVCDYERFRKLSPSKINMGRAEYAAEILHPVAVILSDITHHADTHDMWGSVEGVFWYEVAAWFGWQLACEAYWGKREDVEKAISERCAEFFSGGEVHSGGYFLNVLRVAEINRVAYSDPESGD
jgi:hypothetical protein